MANQGRKVKIECDELTLWKVGTFIFAALFVISWVTGGFQGGSSDVGILPTGAAVQVPNAQAPSQVPAPAEVVDVSADDDAVKGDKDAPVEIIEFSDFECPFCARFYLQTLPMIEKEYISTGKAKLIFRDLPLPFHAEAQKGAEAAECAGDQGKFWEMHDIIFENQEALSMDSLKKWAVDLGLDSKEFNDCLDSGKHEQEVKDDLADANAVGATGTPTFFINGIKITGAQPFEAFRTVIEQELAK